MILKNLLHRKIRSLLTIFGIAIGVAAIIALGAVARGMEAGFTSMTRGSEADLVLSKAEAYSVLLSSVDEQVAEELLSWREIEAVDGVLFGNTLTEDGSYLFFSGHDPAGFSIDHYRLVAGVGLAEARMTRPESGQGLRGDPLLLGQRAANTTGKEVGDIFHVSGGTFRVVGIYETGDGFEDSSVVIPLERAQAITLQPRKASMFYLKLRSPADEERVRQRVARQFTDLALSTTTGFSEQEMILDILAGMALAVSGLAVIIGGISMTNTLFMSVFERTREIGLFRALGWRRRQVLGLILSESLLLALLGGLTGVALGVGAVWAINQSSSMLGMFGSQFTPQLFIQAFVTVFVLGLAGGTYPAWWASRLQPIEALRYERGGGQHFSHTLPGGMVVRNLLRRWVRTSLTLLGIGVSVAAIVTLGGVAYGTELLMTEMFRASQTDLFVLEAGVDADFSAIDERVGARIAARADVEAVSGSIMTGISKEETFMLIILGYAPHSFAMRHFRIVEGAPLAGRHQVIVGRPAAEQLGVGIGDTVSLLKSNFRVVGIYETGVAYEDSGVVIGLREAQELVGKPHQVMYYAIKLRDPGQAEAVKAELAAAYPQLDFVLTAEIAESMSDFEVMRQMMMQISLLAVFIGGLGMLNTMLMSVLERTWEIGVLRALGWRRQQILGMIFRESLLLGALGGICGILLGVGLGSLMALLPGAWSMIAPVYTPQLLGQAFGVALMMGAVGGLYPAWRATRMSPVEALRYE